MTGKNKANEGTLYDAREMTEVDGEREGSLIYDLGARQYHREIRSKDSAEEEKLKRSRCMYRGKSKKGCTAKVETTIDGKFRVTGVHRCEKEVPFLEERKMYHSLQHEAVNTPDQPHAILNRACIKPEFKNVNTRFSASRADSIIKRARDGIRSIPDHLQGLTEGFKNDKTNPLHKHFKGEVKFIDEKMNEQNALIFITDDMIEQLDRAEKLFIDGIMKPIPTKPKARQIWVLHIKFKPGVSLPAVYAYCDGAKGGLYKAILERLVELAPGLKQNLQAVMTDFEAAEINAIRSVFGKAVTRHWYDLELEKAPQIILFFAWALALAPSDRFEEGLRIIFKRILLHVKQFPKLHTFHAYLHEQWLPKAALVSVFDEDDRTNNASEACNRHLTGELGGRKPPLWTLLFNLAKYMNETDGKLRRVLAGVKINKSYDTKKQRADNNRIKECQRQLATGEVDLEKFLFEIISEERQQEILSEIKLLIEDFGVEPQELASNEVLFYMQRILIQLSKAGMSTLPCPRVKPPKRVGNTEATTTHRLEEMNARDANEVIKSLANETLGEYVLLVPEGEEYGSKACRGRGRSGRGKESRGDKVSRGGRGSKRGRGSRGGRGYRGGMRGLESRPLQAPHQRQQNSCNEGSLSAKRARSEAYNDEEHGTGYLDDEEEYINLEILDLDLLQEAEDSSILRENEN